MVERFPAMLQEPGVVLNYAKSGGGEVETGRYPQGVDHLVERMVMDLRASGFDAQAEPRIERWKHEKLIINVGSPFAGIFGPGAETARIRAALEAEAYACFQAAGIDVPTREEAAKIGRGPVYDFDTIPDAPPFASSLWQGIMRGQRTAETDYINGEIALLGALHGVLAPVNHALNQLANRCARDGVKPGTVTVAAFERWVGGGPPPLG
jgi:2-dehydropantoate 2-reductase